MRGRKRKGTRYFGPYAHAYAIRDTLDVLLRSFPIRTCSPAKFRQHERLGRPCLLFHIEKCTGPCVGEIEEMPYRQLVTELCDFLDGDTDAIVKRLDGEMRAAATTLEFERAARVRDRLTAVRRAIERQQMVADRNEDLDVIGIAEDELEASVQVFFVRRGPGRRAARGSSSTRSRTLTPGRADRPHPREPVRRRPAAGRAQAGARAVDVRGRRRRTRSGCALHARLAGAGPGAAARRQAGAAARPSPRNAQEEFTRHRLRRASDHNTPQPGAHRAAGRYLGLPEAPLRIECYDMAHLQGTDYVGSMVVLEDGLPNKREYRRFKVHVPGNDDYAAMEEVLTRRLTAYLAERDRPTAASAGDKPGALRLPAAAARRRRRQGPARRGRAGRARARAGGRDPRRRRWPSGSRRCSCPGGRSRWRSRGGARRCSCCSASATRPTASPTRSTASGAAKRMTTSALDGIAGLGETRKKRLVKELGGVNAVKAADARRPAGAAVAARRRRRGGPRQVPPRSPS